MLQLPPLPTWDALHPLIIHFPIALLFVSPVFILIGAFLRPAKGRPYLNAALILLVLGTISLFVGVHTGQAAGELVDQDPPVGAMLHAHQTLAVETTDVFVVLSLIACGLFLIPRLLGKADTLLLSRVFPLSFLVLYAVGIVFLINTADRGGRMVHEFGVHAMIAPTTEKAATPAANTPGD